MIAIEQSKNELTKQLDREPTMTELANAVAQTEAKVQSILQLELENDLQINLAQIGKELNLSRERIRQIQVLAISILRHQQNDIQEYLLD